MNFNDAAIDKFKNDLKTELKTELAIVLTAEVVSALNPHFEIIKTRFDEVNGRLEIIEKHMGRHCKEIQKLESTVKSHNRVLRSHDVALKKLIRGE